MYAINICWENTHKILEGAQKFAVLTPHDVHLHKDKKTLLPLRINIFRVLRWRAQETFNALFGQLLLRRHFKRGT